MPEAVKGIAAQAVRTGAWHLVQVRTHGPCGCKASKCLQPAAQNLFLQVCALAGFVVWHFSWIQADVTWCL